MRSLIGDRWGAAIIYLRRKTFSAFEFSFPIASATIQFKPLRDSQNRWATQTQTQAEAQACAQLRSGSFRPLRLQLQPPTTKDANDYKNNCLRYRCLIIIQQLILFEFRSTLCLLSDISLSWLFTPSWFTIHTHFCVYTTFARLTCNVLLLPPLEKESGWKRERESRIGEMERRNSLNKHLLTELFLYK